MKSTEPELTKFFDQQIKLEEEIVRSVDQALMTLTNQVVKGVLKGISLDSTKHAEIYRAAAEVAHAPPALTEEEFENLKETVKKHIEYEERTMERLKRVIEKTRNEKAKLLLESIFADEERHHDLLNKIMSIVVRGETITERDWWDFLWSNVPFHGAPGG